MANHGFRRKTQLTCDMYRTSELVIISGNNKHEDKQQRDHKQYSFQVLWQLKHVLEEILQYGMKQQTNCRQQGSLGVTVRPRADV